MDIKRNYKRIIIALVALLFFSAINAASSSTNLERKAQLGMSSFGVEALGQTVFPQMTIEESGSIGTNDLELLLTLNSPVEKVTMVRPDGTEETKTKGATFFQEEEAETSSKKMQDIVLGTSSSKEDTVEKKADASLGFSGEKVAASPKSNDNPVLGQNDLPQMGTYGIHDMVFSVTTYGTYSFKLYQGDDTYVTTITYLVKQGVNPDALSLSLKVGTNFTLRQQLEVDVSYTPSLPGQAEKLVIVLPPFFNINASPPSTSSYTVTRTQRDIPEDFYDDLNSAKMVAYMKSRNIKLNAIEVVFLPNVDQTFNFIFFAQYNNSNHMGPIMTAYEADADKIPMRFAAFGQAATNPVGYVDSEIIAGTSRITTVDGSAPFDQKPVMNNANKITTLGVRYDRLDINAGDGLNHELMFMEEWHYPTYDINAYIPLPDGAKSLPAGGVPMTINGKGYVKYTFGNVNNFGSIGTRGWLHQTLGYYINNIMRLHPGQVLPGGEIYIDYSHLGQRYEMVKAGATTDVKVAEYTTPGKAIAFRQRVNNTWGLNYDQKVREQDMTEEGIRYTFYNKNQNLITPAFKNAEVTFDFPYELSPVSIRFRKENNGSTLKKVVYYLHGNPVAQTMTIPENAENLVFPVTTDQHIVKVVFQYNEYYMPASNTEYYITHINRKYDDKGDLLPGLFPTQMGFSITAEEDSYVFGGLLPEAEQVKVPFVFNDVIDFDLYREVPEDSLLFGGNVTYTSQTVNMYQMTVGDEFYTGNSRFGFKKTTKLMKDYKDLVVSVYPSTPADKAAFSLLRGFQVVDMLPGVKVERGDAFYKTNRRDSWIPATSHIEGKNLIFSFTNLWAGEYPIEAKIEFGTMYGEKMVNLGVKDQWDSASGGIGWVNIHDTTHMIMPKYKTSRVYFEGALEERAIRNNETWNIESKASTSDEAQFINPGAGANPSHNANRAKVTVTFNAFGSANLQRYGTGTATGGGNVYQGDTVTYRYTSGAVNTNGDTKWDYEFKIKIYVETNPQIELLSFGNHTFIKREVLSNGNNLYLYEGFADGGNKVDVTGQIYIKPDAKIANNVPGILRVGISHEDFIDKYMYPGYELDPPYYSIAVRETSSFPPEWDITDKAQYTIATGINFNIVKAVLNNVHLDPVVNDLSSGGIGSFRDHEKQNLGVDAFTGNTTGSAIQRYEIHYLIPRTYRDTESKNEEGVLSSFKNEFNMYLTGLVEETSVFQGFAARYVDKDGKDIIGLTAASPQSEFDKVTDVYVTFENLMPDELKAMRIPLRTDYEKLGNNISPKFAYVGAYARKGTAEGVWENFNLANAQHFTFNSYEFSFRMALDTNEEGKMTTVSNVVGEAKIYYLENGVSKLLHTVTTGDNTLTKSLLVNTDVEKIEINPQNDALYRLTLEKSFSNAGQDSDFPRVEDSFLLIDQQDLVAGTAGKYDAGFIILPKIELVDMTMLMGQSLTQIPKVGMATNINTKPPVWANYKREISATANPAIATASFASDTITANGVLFGTTTYTYKLTNRIGDIFEVVGTIIVNRPVADLKVNIQGNNIWKPHGAPVFLVKIEGIEGDIKDRVYYQIATLPGGTDVVGNILTASATSGKEIVFKDTPIGKYRVSVVSGPRFLPLAGTNMDVTLDSTTGVLNFEFAQKEYKYLSDTDSGALAFTIV